MKTRVLVACEFSGIVRDAFLAKGFDAWSCDILPSQSPGPHLQCDVTSILNLDWDLLIAHPPCTRLCNSGVRWLSKPPPGRSLPDLQRELREGAELFSCLLNAPIPHICVENPVMHKYAKALIRNYRPFSQSIQPWQFGHGETKRTCLWLKNLPPLSPTNIVPGRTHRIHHLPKTPIRSQLRSLTFPGIAHAMASQWPHHILRCLL